MLNKQFWNEYEQLISKSSNYLLNWSKIQQMEEQILLDSSYRLSDSLYSIKNRELLQRNIGAIGLCLDNIYKQTKLLQEHSVVPRTKKLKELSSLQQKTSKELAVNKDLLKQLMTEAGMRKEVENTIVEKQPVEKGNERWFTLGELKQSVEQSEDGLFKIPETQMTVADHRYFNQLKVPDKSQILCVSSLDAEYDYFILTGDDTVTWRDNWSGEEDRIYKGEILDHMKFKFFEESFEMMSNGLTFQVQSTEYNGEIEYEDEEEYEF